MVHFGIKVLHVDDDKSYREKFSATLGEEFEIISSNTLENALERIDTDRIDRVVTDGNLTEGVHGVAARCEGQQIVDKAKAKQIPVAVWASDPQKITGADAYFNKNDMSNFFEKMSAWLTEPLVGQASS